MARLRVLLLGLLASSWFYPGFANALGLGEIHLHSALNQPLDAEIELLQVGDLGAEDIKVRLASAEEFSRVGVERFHFLNDLRFTPLLDGKRSLIRVRSSKAVREPYLNFIVELARPNGNLLREYTVLIDPPGTVAYAEPPAIGESQPQQQSTPPAPAWQREPGAPLPAAVNGQRYQVQRGDSLWIIAGRLQAQGATPSREALMSDIHALNPQAFTNNDPARLRADVQLLLPDSAALAAAQAAPAPQALPAAVVDEPAPVAAAEPSLPLQEQQARVDAELAEVNAQNEQLRSSLKTLQEQLRQLQAQMTEKDQQLQQIRSQLEQPAPPAAAATAAAPSPVLESNPNGWGLWLVGALLLLVLAAVALWSLRRRRPQPVEAEFPRPQVAPLVSQPAVQVTAQEAPPPAPTVTPPSVPTAAPRPAAQRTPLPDIDPLEGANIYIAYGRFADAASNLRKAILVEPERLDLRLRLLEVYGELGDASAFFEQERQLRDMGASHVQVDQIRARYQHLLAQKDTATPSVLPEEHHAEPAPVLQDDFQLNLDDLSLDADWGLSSPFQPDPAPRAKSSKPSDQEFDPDFSSNLQELPEVSEMHDSELLDSFAELPQEQLFAEEAGAQRGSQASTFEPLASDFADLAGDREHLVRLNTALAYIEQGDIGSACDILNELISTGDEQQREQARELLAKIA